ncbi:DUF4942 domain-containing protein [Piscirickettsia salmonis]|uniref:DUF4942 domain-containing protein n=1 Tax=Piscirickettsia salmonis TaxID=1238 RepID=UPI0018ACE128|nr:DUF4942 domain-containing protein [Piscirickettsia salmonis]
MPTPPIDEITRIVEQRNKAKSLIEQGLDLIFDAIEVAPEYSFRELSSDIYWYAGDRDKNKCKLAKSLDRQCWLSLIKRTKLAAVLNTKQADKFYAEVDNAPEFTRDSAMATFMDWFAKREQNFKEGLVDLFKSLSGNYKSHDAFKVKKRIIMSGIFSGKSWSYYSSGQERFKDFCNYAFILNGVDPTSVSSDKQPDLIVGQGLFLGKDEFIFDGYRVVVFLNGNMHIWLEEKLLNKINQCISDYYGKRPPSSEVQHYSILSRHQIL